MITFDDIKAVYSCTSDSEINKTYTERQKENSRLNNEIAKEVFFEFPSEIISMPSNMSDSEKVSYLISLFLNSGNKRLINIVLEVLKNIIIILVLNYLKQCKEQIIILMEI